MCWFVAIASIADTASCPLLPHVRCGDIPHKWQAVTHWWTLFREGSGCLISRSFSFSGSRAFGAGKRIPGTAREEAAFCDMGTGRLVGWCMT